MYLIRQKRVNNIIVTTTGHILRDGIIHIERDDSVNKHL